MNDKWKGFPCKNCLIKRACTGLCFEWPSNHAARVYVHENKLKKVCLRCGSTDVHSVTWYCENCSPCI